MAGNKSLWDANANKEDEFYTQLSYIEEILRLTFGVQFKLAQPHFFII